LNCTTVTPSAPNADFTARAIFCTTGAKRASTCGSASSRLREGTFGTISVCPGACGMASMNTSVSASS